MLKRGRGRLSSVDMLPEEAAPFVAEANAELQKRKKPQTQILQVLNLKLAGIGVSPISKSAFNRKSLFLAMYLGNIERSREIAAIVGEAKPDDGDIGVLLAETLKTLAFDVISELTLTDEAPSMKLLHQASEMLMFMERAGKISSERREKDLVNFQKKAVKAVDLVAKQKGLTADTVKSIKAQILGVRTAPEKAATPAA